MSRLFCVSELFLDEVEREAADIFLHVNEFEVALFVVALDISRYLVEYLFLIIAYGNSYHRVFSFLFDNLSIILLYHKRILFAIKDSDDLMNDFCDEQIFASDFCGLLHQICNWIKRKPRKP